MRRSPGFALTAIFTLALAITANVIVFGVLQALTLWPVDAPHPDQVMTLARKDDPHPFFAYPEMRDVRDGNTVFSAVAADMIQNFGLEANGTTRPVWGAEVSGQYFEVVGIQPFLGRLLNRSDDDRPGASEAAVLSWPVWKSDFNGDPNIVGKTVCLNKQPYTIVGATPESFYGTEKMGYLDIAQVATVALGLLGAFGLLLSITGTFGLASYTVSQRLRELRIRVALGAQAKQILSAALGHMLILLATDSVVGMLLGIAASRVLSAIVYQASAQDPVVLAAVASTLLLTGSLAVAGPVRRALRIDPANVLREQ